MIDGRFLRLDKKLRFLGDIYGESIYVESEDEAKIQCINKYLLEASDALMLVDCMRLDKE